MAGEGGLFIQIMGGVQKELLSGLSTLSAQLEALSKVAKKTQNVEFSKGIAGLGKTVQDTAGKLGSAINEVNKHLKKYGDATDDAMKKRAAATSKSSKKMEQSFEAIADARKTAFSGKQNKLIEQATKYIQEFGEISSSASESAEIQIRSFKEQIVKLYNSLHDTDALDENVQSMEHLANRMDYAKVAAKVVTGEIKMTAKGFRAYSEEGRKALGLTDDMNQALKKFNVQAYHKKMEQLKDEQKKGAEGAEKYVNALKYLGKRFGIADDQVKDYVTRLDHVRANIKRLSDQARMMDMPDVAKSLEKVKPASAVLQSIAGNLKITKNSMELVSNEARKMFRGLSTKEIDDVIQKLNLMPKKAKLVDAIASSYEKADAEAAQFRKELDKVYSEIEKVVQASGDIKFMEDTDLDVFHRETKRAIIDLNKFKEAVVNSAGLGEKGYNELYRSLVKTNLAIQNQKKAINEQRAEWKKLDKIQEAAEQQLEYVKKKLNELRDANLEAFDVEATRRWKRDLERAESTIDNLHQKAQITTKEYKDQKGAISDLRREAEKYKTTMAKAAEMMDTKGQERAMLSLGKSYGDSTTRINRYKAVIREVSEFDQKHMDQILTKIDRLRKEKKQTQNVRNEIRRLSKEYDGLANEIGFTSKVQKRYKEVLDGVSKKHSIFNRGLKGTQKEMGYVEEQFEHISRRIKQFGAFVAAAFVVREIQYFFRELVNITAEYDQALYNLRAILEITRSQVSLLGEVIKDVARSTKFSALEVAESATILGQAGLTMQETMYAIQGVADLATGTLSSFKTVTELITTALNSFQLAATDTSKVADVFANAINRSKLTVDKLNTAFNYVGAAANQVGVTLNELSGSFMELADRGVRASTMGTGLRKMLLSLIRPTADLATDLDRTGKSLNDINPQIVGFREALRNIAPLMYNVEKGAVDMAKVTDYFGVRAAQVAGILIESVSGASAALDAAIEKTFQFGAASKMADTQIEGLGLKIKNLADRAKNIVIAFSEAGLTGALGNIIDNLKELSAGIESFLSDHPILVWTIAIIAQITILTTLLSGLGPILKNTGAAMLRVVLAHKTFFGVLTGLTVAVSAAVAIFNYFADRHYNAAKAANDHAKELASLTDALEEWGKSFKAAFQTRDWENTIQRFKETEIAGRNLAEMLEEELGTALENLSQTDFNLSKIEDAIKKVSIKSYAEQWEKSLEALEKSSEQLKVIYKYSGEAVYEETKNTFTKLERAAIEHKKGTWIRWPTAYFLEDIDKVQAEYEDAVTSITKMAEKFAETYGYSTETIIAQNEGMIKKIKENTSEGSAAVKAFQEIMARKWFGPVMTELDDFTFKLGGVRKRIEKDWIKTVEDAKKELSDWDIDLSEVRTLDDITAKITEKFVNLREAQEKIFPILQDLVVGNIDFTKAEELIRKELEKHPNVIQDVINRLHGLADVMESTIYPAWETYLAQLEKVDPKIRSRVAEMTDAQKASLYAYRDEFKKEAADLEDFYARFFGLKSLPGTKKEIMKDMGADKVLEILGEIGITAKTAEEGLDIIYENVRKEKFKGLFEQLTGLVDEKTLEQKIKEAEKLFNSLGDTAKNIFKDLDLKQRKELIFNLTDIEKEEEEIKKYFNSLPETAREKLGELTEIIETFRKGKALEALFGVTDDDQTEIENRLARTRIMYGKESLKVLQMEKAVIKERVQERKRLYEEIGSAESESVYLEEKEKLIAKEKEISDKIKENKEAEFEKIEEYNNKIKEAYDERLEKAEQIAEKEKLIIEEKVTKGQILEHEAQMEIAELEFKNAKERLSINEEMISELTKGSDEYKEALIVQGDLVNDVKEKELNRFKATIAGYKAVFDKEMELAEKRKQLAIAGLPEEGDTYEITRDDTGEVVARVRKEEEITYESAKARLEAEKTYRDNVLDSYDAHIEKLKNKVGKRNEDYKNACIEREIFEKETNAEIIKLEEDANEKRIIAYGSLFEQIGYGWRKASEETENWVDKTKELFGDVESSLNEDFLKPLFKGTKSVSEAFRDMAESIADDMLNILSEDIANTILDSLTPDSIGGKSKKSGGGSSIWSTLGGFASSAWNWLGGWFHQGGVVGKDGKLQNVPAVLWANAPRLHGGLGANEYPAILEKGETVIPKEQSNAVGQTNYFNISIQAPNGNISKESQRQLYRKMTQALAKANAR